MDVLRTHRGLAFSLVVLEQIAQAVEPAKHGIVRRIAREKREEALKKLRRDGRGVWRQIWAVRLR